MGRKQRSAFECSSKPSSSSGTLCRMAVSVSCSMRRSRRCMCTLPARDQRQRQAPGRGLEPPAAAAGRCRRSSSSTANQRRPAKRSCNQRAVSASPACSEQLGSQSSKPCARKHSATSSRPTRYSPLGAARRARLMSPHSAAYACRSSASTTILSPSVAGELAADEQLQRQILGRRMRSHDSGHGAFVGQREPGVAELGRGSHELAWMRSPAQEREVAETVQLGIDAVRAVGRIHDCPRSAIARLHCSTAGIHARVSRTARAKTNSECGDRETPTAFGRRPFLAV